jgi:hypothetical protein
VHLTQTLTQESGAKVWMNSSSTSNGPLFMTISTETRVSCIIDPETLTFTELEISCPWCSFGRSVESYVLSYVLFDSPLHSSLKQTHIFFALSTLSFIPA